jgi:recombination protein RecR
MTPKLIEDTVAAFSRMPGIGKKTALRLALHLLQPHADTLAQQLADAVLTMKEKILRCNVCHNLSDTQTCAICSSQLRDHTIICVVADMRDVIALENTAQFRGVYHVLGGLIAPMDGIGASQLNIDSLLQRLQTNEVAEIILALSATMEGDTTAFYISKRLKERNIKISTIARGIAIGGELEYADEVTLGRSITARMPFQY